MAGFMYASECSVPDQKYAGLPAADNAEKKRGARRTAGSRGYMPGDTCVKDSPAPYNERLGRA